LITFRAFKKPKTPRCFISDLNSAFNKNYNEMKEVFITGNLKILRVYYAILGICGAFILGGHTYNYFFGEMMEWWYLNAGVGLILALGGGGYALGVIKPRIPEIFISDEGIRSNKTAWDNSFRWKKLKHVELYKNKITVQYAETGLKNEIAIPYLIRLNSKNLQKLNNGLSGFCEKYELEFSSKLKF